MNQCWVEICEVHSSAENENWIQLWYQEVENMGPPSSCYLPALLTYNLPRNAKISKLTISMTSDEKNSFPALLSLAIMRY